MPEIVNYEVQVQQSGRWSIHARFQSHQKDAALDEGKQLDHLNTVEAVKVIKEVYDSDEGFHNEFIIYKSPGMKSGGGGRKTSGASMARSPSQGTSWITQDDEDDFENTATEPRKARGRIKPPKKQSTMTAIMVKLLMVVLFSLIIGGAFAFLADELLGGTRMFGVNFVGNAESNLLISVFVVSFLVSLVMMSITVMRGETLQSSPQTKAARRAKQAADRARAKAARRKPQQPQPAGAPNEQGAQAGPSAKTIEGGKEDTLDHLEAAMKGVEEFQVEQQTNEDKATENTATTDRIQAELNKDKEPEEAKRAIVLDAETHAKAKVPEVDPLSPVDEKQKAYMLKFLSSGLEGSQTEQKNLDNFNKFGVNLYLAGACEILSQKRNMDLRARSKILSDCVQVMGFKRSHAASFADRYEEYLMADARYMQMFQAGRNAINIFLTDETVAPRLLDNALSQWNKPKQQEEQSGPITVMFTDIAGSTAMTQSLGDAGAQQVVRAHNRIVREALSNNAGKEVKHTGDGIMASFNKTSDGVDASIEMQRETARHNQQNPDLPLHLKIGLNAGEPIAEDNDLFGTTVQLSARIVDKASADEIYVSEIVRGICAGKDYKFTNQGGFAMKGFGDEITLFKVSWSDDGEVQNPGE